MGMEEVPKKLPQEEKTKNLNETVRNENENNEPEEKEAEKVSEDNQENKEAKENEMEAYIEAHKEQIREKAKDWIMEKERQLIENQPDVIATKNRFTMVGAIAGTVAGLILKMMVAPGASSATLGLDYAIFGALGGTGGGIIGLCGAELVNTLKRMGLKSKNE